LVGRGLGSGFLGVSKSWLVEQVSELAAKVGEVVVVESGIAKLVNDRQEVSKRADGLERWLGLGGKEPSEGAQQECGVNGAKRDTAVLKLSCKESVIGARL
jgi:hypothetical protein